MRNPCTFIPGLFLCFGASLHAQTSAMPDSNAYWKEHTVAFMINASSATTDEFEYVSGHVTIGSYTYRQIFSGGHRHYSTGQDYYWTQQYKGAMRDDTLNKKVYFVPPNSQSEVLMYDFNLVLGQQFPLAYASNLYNTSSWHVTAVDSVFFNNAWHHWYHSGDTTPGAEFGWIEGVGSTLGLTKDIPSQGVYDWLTCAVRDSQSVWPGSTYPCDYTVAIPELEMHQGMSVNPVPAKDEVTITLHKLPVHPYTVQMFSISGELLLEKSCAAFAEAKLDVSAMTAGVYFIRVLQAGELPVQQKMIVR